MASLFCVLVLLASSFAQSPASEYAQSSSRGPRTEDLVISYYSNLTSAYEALKSDEIDITNAEYFEEGLPEVVQDAFDDPNIQLAKDTYDYVDRLQLNNNYTIYPPYPSYPEGIRSPTSYVEFRRAIAWCVDKEYMVEVCCQGLAERVDGPVSAMYKNWAASSYWYPNYPYEYDPFRAATELDAAGWVQGFTPNDYYDPEFPGSAQFKRTYPPDHSRAGLDIDPLAFFIVTGYPPRVSASHQVVETLRKIGIPLWVYEGDHPTIRPWVRTNRMYHIAFYNGNWYKAPMDTPIGPYLMYNSSNWLAYPSDNYVTGNNASNLPNYPYLDDLVKGICQSQTIEEAITLSKLYTRFWMNQCITIPLWSPKGYWLYSKRVLGVVSEEGGGPENSFSFMNAYKADGTAIRLGTTSPPASMNTFGLSFQPWWRERNLGLDRMDLYSQADVTPDLACYQSGSVQDWETGIWSDGGINKTRFTRWMRSDAYFVEPMTGNQKSNVNSSHLLFSTWYSYWHQWTVTQPEWVCPPIHHVDIVDPFQVDFYLDDLENFPWWYASYLMWPMLSFDVWLQNPMASDQVESFPSFSGPGVVNLSGQPVWINNVTMNGSPLSMFTDYNIIKGSLEILTSASGNLEVDYWAYGDPSGFTPGNLPWQTCFEGAGMYYATAFTSGVGGSLVLKRNPHYWMETPLLGDVDFKWKWEDGPKPRSGYFKVDIYDVVMAAQAYGSSATGEPDEKWLAAADIAPPGGTINIYDIVTMAGNYGKQWGHTP